MGYVHITEALTEAEYLDTRTWSNTLCAMGLSHVAELPSGVFAGGAGAVSGIFDFAKLVDASRDMATWTFWWDNAIIYFHCSNPEDAVFIALNYSV